MKYQSLAASLAICLGPAAASAAPLTFFGEDAAGSTLPTPNADAAQAAFLANLVGVSVESFEGFATGTGFPIAANFGSTTATLTGTESVSNTGIVDLSIGGRFAISGTKYLNMATADASSLALQFDSPQAAFGFYATDIGDFVGQLALSFDGGPLVTVPHTIEANGSALYFGYIDVDNPFTTVAFKNTASADDAFGFDDFTIGNVRQISRLPDGGATAGLLCGAFGFMAWGRNRVRA